MDAETRSEINHINEELREIKADLKSSTCPQDGCRYMESQGKRPGLIANWLTFAGLLLLLALEIAGRSS
jgi:hypothetical protein